MRQSASLRTAILAAAFALSLGPVSAMTYSTAPIADRCNGECPRVIVAEGQITSRSPDEFMEFARSELARPGLYNVVLIHSPGGSVEAAIRLGLVFRSLGSAVVVGRPVREGRQGVVADGKGLKALAGRCVSACVYTLMGAKKRVVPNESRIGVHRMSAEFFGQDLTRDRNEQLRRRILAGSRELDWLRRYVSTVGGSQDLVSLAESVSPDSIRILTPAEIRRYKLGSPRF